MRERVTALRGELDFAESLRERVATLAGLPESVFDVVRSRISVTNGAQKLIAAVHEADGVVGVVSGGFHELLDPLAVAGIGIAFCAKPIVAEQADVAITERDLSQAITIIGLA